MSKRSVRGPITYVDGSGEYVEASAANPLPINTGSGSLSTKPALPTTDAEVKAFLAQWDVNIAARAGLISGLSGFRKFGANQDIDTGTTPETIWNVGGLYPWNDQTTTFQAEVVSTSANDAAAGTGSRTIRVIGLAGDDWLQVTEDVTMNGTTPVTTVRTDWRRIDRMVGLTAGSLGLNDGDISASATGGGDTYAQMGAGFGQTQLCAMTIPGDRVGLLMGWEASILQAGNGTNAELDLFTRDNTSADPHWRLRATMGLRGAGTTSFGSFRFNMPIRLNGKTDVDVRCTRTTNNNTRIAATFEILGVSNDIINS